MKKLISLILSAILTFSVIPNMDVKAASIKEQAGKAYADIIQKYFSAAELIKAGETNVTDYPELEGIEDQFIYDTLNYGGGISYNIKDLNNDGIPELFSDYSIYTYYSGKAIKLTSFGYRTIFKPCKNGIIELTWGGAYDNTAVFYKLPKNKKKLKTVCHIEFSVNGNTNKATYYDKTKKKTKTISEEKYNKLYRKYNKPIDMTYYEADSKAVSNMRKGIFTYPNQKKWTRKASDWN